jgi:hypothetical protein
MALQQLLQAQGTAHQLVGHLGDYYPDLQTPQKQAATAAAWPELCPVVATKLDNGAGVCVVATHQQSCLDQYQTNSTQPSSTPQ